ncbi:MAG: WXG100 family type VII secretion target [Lachnospira sp.]|nr:WXG100 family type VII secretion target [Lachnospira sp.]
MSLQMYSDLSFTVTPEALYTKSEQVEAAVRSMKNEFDSMKAVINKTASYWIGDAGDTYRKKYSEREPDLETIFARLSEHVTDLNTIAGKYVTAEEKAQQLAETLPADVIV